MIKVHNPLEGWEPPSGAERVRMLREAEEETLSGVAGAVRQEAAERPGWAELAERMDVHADGGRTYVGLPPEDEAAKRAFELEYGTEKEAPTGFLRSAALRHGPQATRRLTGRVLGRIWGGG